MEDKIFYSPDHCPKCGYKKIGLYVKNSEIILQCPDCGYSAGLLKYDYWKTRNLTSDQTWADNIKKLYHCCHICGSMENLEAHHIIPVANSTLLDHRYGLNNGIVLCKDCHDLVHGKKHLYYVAWSYSDEAGKQLIGSEYVTEKSDKKAIEYINTKYQDIKCIRCTPLFNENNKGVINSDLE